MMVVNAMPWLLYPQERPHSHSVGGLQGRYGQVQKILPPLEFNPWTFQPIVSCYTDYTSP
jgi:hypothetical protein